MYWFSKTVRFVNTICRILLFTIAFSKMITGWLKALNIINISNGSNWGKLRLLRAIFKIKLVPVTLVIKRKVYRYYSAYTKIIVENVNGPRGKVCFFSEGQTVVLPIRLFQCRVAKLILIFVRLAINFHLYPEWRAALVSAIKLNYTRI